MVNEKFTGFLASLHAHNPTLLESIYDGYVTLFEDGEAVAAPFDFYSNFSSVEADFDDKGNTIGTMYIHMTAAPEMKALIASIMKNPDDEDIENLRNADSIVLNIPFSFSGGEYEAGYYSGGGKRHKQLNDPADSHASLEGLDVNIDNDGDNHVTNEDGVYICSIDIEKNPDFLSSIVELCSDEYSDSATEYLLAKMEEDMAEREAEGRAEARMGRDEYDY